jgi:hypothetical protein
VAKLGDDVTIGDSPLSVIDIVESINAEHISGAKKWYVPSGSNISCDADDTVAGLLLLEVFQ